MKVFISGKWTAKSEISLQMEAIKSLGHQITFDWTKFEEEGDGIDKLRQAAINDIEGVREADILISNMSDPNYAYRGTFCELGCALALNKKIIILCPDQKAICREQPFFYHPLVTHCSTWEEVLEEINNRKN